MKILKLGGHNFDLMPDAEMPLTFQISSPGDMNIYTARSTRFDLPFTGNNIKNLGYLHIPATTSTIFRNKISAIYEQDGIKFEGYAIIESAGENIICTLYFGNYDFCKTLADKKLSDLDLTAYECTWNVQAFIDQCDVIIGMKWNLIDWFENEYFDDGSGRDVLLENYLPSFFFHTLFTEIIISSGFSLNTSDYYYGSDLFNKLIIPVVDIKSDIYRTDIGSAAQNGTETISDTNDHIILLTSVTDPFFEPGTGKLRITADGTYYTHYSLTIELNSVAIPPGNSMLVRVFFEAKAGEETIYLNYKDWNMSYGDPMPPPYIFGGNSLDELVKGQDIVLHIYTNKPAYAFEYKYYSGGMICDSAELTKCGIGHTFQIAKNLPDLTQLDFIKTLVKMMNLLVQDKNGTICFKTFKELVESTDFDDWSDKFVGIVEQNLISEMGQKNYCKYTEGDDDIELADSEIDINNDVLELEKDFIDLPFANCAMFERFTAPVINMPRIQAIGDEFSSPTPRILIDDLNSGGDGHQLDIVDDLTTTQAITSDYPQCYFYLDGKSENLRWEDLIENYYSEFADTMNNYRLIKAKMRLTTLDVYNLDMLKIKYIRQLNSYYLLIKIKNWLPGKDAECELLKLR